MFPNCLCIPAWKSCECRYAFLTYKFSFDKGQDDPFGNILVDRPTVPYASPEITIESIQEGKLERMQGDSIHLRCEGTGNPKPLVSWRRVRKSVLCMHLCICDQSIKQNIVDNPFFF